jgi:hypothetical protein
MQYTNKQAAEPMHFFASSAFQWRTNDNLEQLIGHMKQKGKGFSLWRVPLPESASYSIDNFRPEVEGTVYLGRWD